MTMFNTRSCSSTRGGSDRPATSIPFSTYVHISRIVSSPVLTRKVADTEDVVAQHRRRNRAPRLPGNAQLLAIRQQQLRSTTPNLAGNAPVATTCQASSHSSHQEATLPPDPSQSSTPLESTQSRPKVGSTMEGTDPSQLQFYEPAVRDVIERAKQFSHCDAASINAFPNRAEFNKFALEYIEEGIEERRSQSLLVPDGNADDLISP